MSKFRLLSDNVINRVDYYPYIISKSIAEILEFWKQLNVVETSAVKLIIGTLPIQEGDCYTPRNSIYQVLKSQDRTQFSYDIAVTNYVQNCDWPELRVDNIRRTFNRLDSSLNSNEFKFINDRLEFNENGFADNRFDCKGATITDKLSPVLVF